MSKVLSNKVLVTRLLLFVALVVSLLAPPTQAWGATSITNWENLPGAQVYIEIGHEKTEYKLNDSRLYITYNDNGTVSGVAMRAGNALPAGNTTITNAVVATCPGAALDAATGKRYDVIVYDTPTFHVYSATTTPSFSEVENSSLGNFNICAVNTSVYLMSPQTYAKKGVWISHQVRVQVVDPDTKAVINKTVQMVVNDLDASGSVLGFGKSNTHSEGITLPSDAGEVYLDHQTLLSVSGSRYYHDAGEDTLGNDNYDPRYRFATNMKDGDFTFTWTGASCATSVFADNYGYPNVPVTTTKTSMPTSVFMGDEIEYAIKTNFAYFPTSGDFSTPSIVVSDVLDSALDISKAEVSMSSNSNAWSISKSGQTLTMTLKRDGNSFIPQGPYTFFVKAPIKAGAAITSLRSEGGDYYVSNNATVKINNITSTSNTVKTIVNSAQVNITKSAAFENKVGDEVTYTLTVKNPKAGSIAENVVISDTSLPAGFELVANSLNVSGVPASVTKSVVGDNHAAQTKTLTNTVTKTQNGKNISVVIPYLPAANTATITFKARCIESFNGKETLNSATARIDNPSPGAQASSSAKEGIWINSANLSLSKTADAYEYRIGDKAKYTISVSNTIPGTIAKNVYITDSAMNTRVAVDPDSIKVNGVPTTVSYPIDSNGIGGQTGNKANNYTLNKVGNGFNLLIPYLPYGQLVTITYEGECTTESDGLETMNEARASFDNPLSGASPIIAKEGIWTNDAEIELYKTVDAYETQVGNISYYTIQFYNDLPGTIANNVLLEDISLPSGFVLDKSSIKVDGVPTSVAYPIDSNGVGGQTENRPNRYTIDEKGNGFGIGIDYLPAGNYITVTYEALATEEVNGNEITNTARIYADNLINDEVPTSSAKVWINSPELKVSKTVKDKRNEYNIGDIVTYRIQIDNTKRGTVAWGVELTDVFDLEAFELIRGSIMAFEEEGGVIRDVSVSQNMFSSTFHIDTNEALLCTEDGYISWVDGTSSVMGEYNPALIWSQSRIYVEFQAIVKNEAMAGEDITNTIEAWGSNVDKASDKETVHIHEDPHVPPIILGDSVTTYKTSSPAANSLVSAGDSITYTLSSTNTGLKLQPFTLIRDYIPYGTTFEAANDGGVYVAADAEGNASGRDYVEWVITDLDVKQTKDVSFSVTVDSTTPKRIYNYALTSRVDHEVVAGNVSNPEPQNPSNEVAHKTRAEINLGPIVEVIKSSDPYPGTIINPASDITYTLTVKNSGDEAANKVAVFDKLGENLNFKSYEEVHGAALNFDSTGIGWNIDTLSPGESVELEYVCTTAENINEGVAISNQASFATNTASIPSRDLANTSNIVMHSVPEPTLELFKASNPENGTEVHPGDEIEYLLRLKNTGKTAALNIGVFDALPEYMNFVRVNSTYQAALNTEGTGIGFKVDRIEAGKFIDLVFVMKVADDAPEDTRISNVATFGGTKEVPDTALPQESNQVIHIVTTDHPAVSVTKSSNPTVDTPVKPGDEIEYLLNVTNTSNFVATGVAVFDAIPENTTLVSVERNYRANVADDERSIGWFVGELQPTERAQLIFKVRVNDNAPENSLIVNQASYGLGKTSAPIEELGETSNKLEHKVASLGKGVLEVMKTANPASGTKVKVGQEITYSIKVKNVGSNKALGVVIHDVVPASTTFVSVDRNYRANVIDKKSIGWFIGDLEPQETAEVSFTASVAKGTKEGSNISNAATYSTGLTKAPDAPLGNTTNEVAHRVEYSDPAPEEEVNATPVAPDPSPTEEASSNKAKPSGSYSGTSRSIAGKFYEKTGNVLFDYWYVFLGSALIVLGASFFGAYARSKSKENMLRKIQQQEG